MHSSRSVICVISSYAVLLLVIFDTLSEMTLAAPTRGSISLSCKSKGKVYHNKVSSKALSALFRAAFHIWQKMPKSMKPPPPTCKVITTLVNSIENNSSFEEFQ